MKNLLVAINARYNHTNLAVRSISLYANSHLGCNQEIFFIEFTINQRESDILRGIVMQSPDIVIFSTYIWNVQIFERIATYLKKILPNCIIGAGGPEVGFYAEEYLKKNPAFDFIISGEGEETVKEIAEQTKEQIDFSKMRHIKGLFLKGDETGKTKKVIFTGERELICNLENLPFAYPEISKDDAENKIFYYESSRGCPFSCSYCMSSLEKKVRFLPLDRVFIDLQRFLDANVCLVKFVDRTFNLDEKRYIAIWKYILEHHNKKTMFHFEIEAEFLSDEALDFLKTVPKNVMQFEIGVQSANPKTLKTISRSSEIQKLAENIKRIPKTIHSHLDLIVGLPFEDLISFKNSFDFVMNLNPDVLQLGFLKILHGTAMEQYAKQNGWKWMDFAPYETLSTPYMSYKDIQFLKDVETLVDAYYNSGDFAKTIRYLGRIFGFWNFFSTLTQNAKMDGALDVARNKDFWTEYLVQCLNQFEQNQFEQQNLLAYHKESACSEQQVYLEQRTVINKFSFNVALELLRCDFINRKKTSNFPKWYVRHYNKAIHLQLMKDAEKNYGHRIEFAFSDYEEFSIDVDSLEPEKTSGIYKKLIIYR